MSSVWSLWKGLRPCPGCVTPVTAPDVSSQHRLKKFPRVGQCWFRRIGFKKFRDQARVDRRLAYRCKTQLFDQDGGDDNPDGLYVIEPVEIRVRDDL